MTLSNWAKGKLSDSMRGDLVDEGIGVVLLFIVMSAGIMMMTLTNDLTPESSKLDYTYTTATNSTVLTLNGSTNQTHTVYVSAVASITGETPVKRITATADNQNTTTDYSITVWLNGVSLGTITADNNTVTSQAFNSVGWVAGVNNITYNTNNTLEEVFVNSTVGIYPSSTTNTDTGDLSDEIPNYTAKGYQVLFFVMILALIGLAIWSIKRFTGSGGGVMN